MCRQLFQYSLYCHHALRYSSEILPCSLHTVYSRFDLGPPPARCMNYQAVIIRIWETCDTCLENTLLMGGDDWCYNGGIFDHEDLDDTGDVDHSGEGSLR